MADNCEYCDSIAAMTGTSNCPIHSADLALFEAQAAELAESGKRDGAKLTGDQLTAVFGQASRRKLDRGRRCIEDSPIFGGERQEELF